MCKYAVILRNALVHWIGRVADNGRRHHIQQLRRQASKAGGRPTRASTAFSMTGHPSVVSVFLCLSTPAQRVVGSDFRRDINLGDAAACTLAGNQGRWLGGWLRAGGWGRVAGGGWLGAGMGLARRQKPNKCLCADLCNHLVVIDKFVKGPRFFVRPGP